MTSAILHQSSWVLTAQQSAIELYSSHHTFPQRPLLFIGGMHGDEPEGVQLAQDLLGWLQKNHNPQELRPWALIPCLNPDGYRSQKRTNSSGVDLNRNFPTGNWTATHNQDRYYPGVRANSEIEVQGLIRWIEEHHPEVIFHFHSWEPCVVYTGEPGKIWAEEIARHTPYKACADIGYSTPGSLGDFAWEKWSIPVICIEAPEKSDLSKVWPTFGPGLQSVLSHKEFPPNIKK